MRWKWKRRTYTKSINSILTNCSIVAPIDDIEDFMDADPNQDGYHWEEPEPEETENLQREWLQLIQMEKEIEKQKNKLS